MGGSVHAENPKQTLADAVSKQTEISSETVLKVLSGLESLGYALTLTKKSEPATAPATVPAAQ